MKAALLATAAAIAGTAIADGAHMRRHAHEALHQRRAVQAGGDSAGEHQHQNQERCGCETEIVTYYGSPTCK